MGIIQSSVIYPNVNLKHVKHCFLWTTTVFCFYMSTHRIELPTNRSHSPIIKGHFLVGCLVYTIRLALYFSVWVFPKVYIGGVFSHPKSVVRHNRTALQRRSRQSTFRLKEKTLTVFPLVKAPQGPLTSISERPSCVIGKWRTRHSGTGKVWRIPVEALKQSRRGPTSDNIMTLQYIPTWPHIVF